jgi:hypothetical protein
MTFTTNEPYAPTTAGERTALREHKLNGGAATLRGSFEAGVQATSVEPVSELDLADLWDAFVEADMKLQRSYPSYAEAFIAGYRFC